LIYGGPLTKSLQKRNGESPAATDVVQETARVKARPELTAKGSPRLIVGARVESFFSGRK
jgi:hypothetical protein